MTELYMLTDQSDNYKDTWAFLDRRLDDMNTLGSLPHQVTAEYRSIMFQYRYIPSLLFSFDGVH